MKNTQLKADVINAARVLAAEYEEAVLECATEVRVDVFKLKALVDAVQALNPNDDPVDVMFRVDRERRVFAMFPNVVEANGCVGTWEILGGSSCGPGAGLIAASRPANPSEYAETAKALRKLHPIRIVKRSSRKPRFR